MQSPFQQGLEANEANYSPLSPLSLLRRVAEVHGGRVGQREDERRKAQGRVAVGGLFGHVRVGRAPEVARPGW